MRKNYRSSVIAVLLCLVCLVTTPAGLGSTFKTPTHQTSAKKKVRCPDALQSARRMLKREFPQLSSRGGYSRSGRLARQIFDTERIHGVGPTTEALWKHAERSGCRKITTIYTTYAPRFNKRYCASGVQYLHYGGYRVACNRVPLGSLVLLRYKNLKSYKYCVVIIADTGKLYKDYSRGAVQIDNSHLVGAKLGFYQNGNRYGEAIILPHPKLVKE